MHWISEGEIEELQGYFSKVLHLPQVTIDYSRRQWKNKAVFVKSLCHRVSSEWVAREVKLKMKLTDEPDVFPIAEDHLILQFKDERDCALVRKGGPWFVAG